MRVLELYQQDGFRAKKAASSNGNEWCGPCPFCGGKDRFRLWPEKNKGGRYWCRQCNQKGDGIEYLRQVRGVGYHQACALIGIVTGTGTNKTTDTCFHKSSRQEATIKDYRLPSNVWMERARIIIEQCVFKLWSSEGSHILEWLHKSRFLDDESIKQFYLGYNDADLYEPREDWDLQRETDECGKVRKVWIPAGLLIPYWKDGRLIRLRVRRFKEQGPRYVIIPGSSLSPMIMLTRSPSVIVLESELDGMLINQEAGDLVNTVALGALSMKPDKETHRLLTTSKHVLIAFDRDTNNAGGKAAWNTWSNLYPLARRCPVICGKDPADAARNGLDIRLWIQVALDGGAERMAVSSKGNPL